MKNIIIAFTLVTILMISSIGLLFYFQDEINGTVKETEIIENVEEETIKFIDDMPQEVKRIKNEINKSNYCQVDSDCKYAGSQCPFGCWIYVNEKEVEKISKLISEYPSKCIYSCMSCETARCNNNKCEAICQ